MKKRQNITLKCKNNSEILSFFNLFIYIWNINHLWKGGFEKQHINSFGIVLCLELWWSIVFFTVFVLYVNVSEDVSWGLVRLTVPPGVSRGPNLLLARCLDVAVAKTSAISQASKDFGQGGGTLLKWFCFHCWHTNRSRWS